MGDHPPYVEPTDAEDVFRLTPDGIAAALQAYLLYKDGEDIENIEAALGLEAGTKGEEDEHIEFKVLMAFGNHTGLFDQFEEYQELQETFDEIEREYNNE